MEFSALDKINPVFSQTYSNLKQADDIADGFYFSGPKIGGLTVTPEVIAQWIRDTLEDATYFKIPGTITKPECKDILRQYGIDRESLAISGIPEPSITRLYRCMFIYSIGFNELLLSILAHAKSKITLASSVWKVFTILLEYSWKADYKALINELEEKHDKEIKAIQKVFDSQVGDLNNQIGKYR